MHLVSTNAGDRSMEIGVEVHLAEISVLSLKRHSRENRVKYIVLKHHLDSEAFCFNTSHSLRGGARSASVSS